MIKQLRGMLAWVVPLGLAALYGILTLTNVSPGDFFAHLAWGSNLYANAWHHLLAGNFLVDPAYAPGEYFIVGPGKYVAYFGYMPTLVRAIGDIFLADIYRYNLANLSMVAALLLACGSVLYALRRLARGAWRNYIVGGSILLALVLASPLSYLLAWSWTYHEVIIWGLAWSLLFVSLYAVWIFGRGRTTWVHGLLLGVAVGMAVLCRPTIALTLILPYAYLCCRSLLAGFRRHEWAESRQLAAGMAACALLAAAVMTINYQRWGSPFTFVHLDKNVQLVTLYPERAAALREAGEFNPVRIPYSMYYYFVPSSANFQSSFPFITLDRELSVMAHAPQYDYIEGSRVPLPVSATYLLLLAGAGVYSWRYLRRSEKQAAYWLCGGAAMSALAIVMVYATAVRYSVEFLPVLVFLGLVFAATQARHKIVLPRRVYVIGGSVLVLSAYATQVTMLGYKEFVWDQPAAARHHVRQVIDYRPQPDETKHIINGEKFPVY